VREPTAGWVSDACAISGGALTEISTGKVKCSNYAPAGSCSKGFIKDMFNAVTCARWTVERTFTKVWGHKRGAKPLLRPPMISLKVNTTNNITISPNLQATNVTQEPNSDLNITSRYTSATIHTL
jgi:hypothetical protein